MLVKYILTLLLLASGTCWGVERVYYVGIEEIEWDYAPSGRNLIFDIPLKEDIDTRAFTTSGRDRIGRKYKKVVFYQYEDSAFKVRTQRPIHMGILGPTLKAEIGDVIVVHVRNFASRHYGLHPHGMDYSKAHEGAVYEDRSASVDKQDDTIPPGGFYTYKWNAAPKYGPAESEPNCSIWAYHSHIIFKKDTNSGLVGTLLICRQGTLDERGNRRDVDKEFILLFTVFDENESWYLDENIETYTTNPKSVNTEDGDFQESNKMHGINGYICGNLLGLSACHGDTVTWHILGMGTVVDKHSVHFQGQTVVINGHRQDTISIFPASFSTATMKAGNTGNWKIECLVNDHHTAGMIGSFQVDQCTQKSPELIHDVIIKHYYIAIKEQEWSYAPLGRNMINNKDLLKDGSDSKTFFERDMHRIGGVYQKALFLEYESGRYATRKSRDETLGIMGPLIAAEVGDVIRVTLKNFAREQTYNIEPHGVEFSDVTHLAAGEQHTYTWVVRENESPTDLDSDCITYLYTSTVDSGKDTNSGLVGPLIVCKKGTLETNLERRAYYLLFTVFDENLSHYLDLNIQKFTAKKDSVEKEDADFVKSNLMHSINGLMYGNLFNIDMCIHEETDFRIIGLGSEIDMHSVHLSGLNINFRHENVGTLNVFPHTTSSFTTEAHEIGSGEILCRTNDHLIGGMLTLYNVVDCGGSYGPTLPHKSGKTRTYYIGAVEEVWDYFPSHEDIFGHGVNTASSLYIFTRRQKGKFIGSRYLKALYYEYTDATFTQRKKKGAHLGVLGPVISAEEGDEIHVVFKNMANRRYSINPWGARDKEFNTSRILSARPGKTVRYNWKVPASAAPNTGNPDCNSWMYMSDIDPVNDICSGLVGPLLICRKGTLSSRGSIHSDKEFFLLFTVFDENNSHYLDDNIKLFAETDPRIFDKEDDAFVESNLLHGINGRLEHLEGLSMYNGDRVIWHLMGLGNEIDLHTVHFHGHVFNHTSDKVTHSDVFDLFPGKIGTLEMNVNKEGNWLLHCHVNDHVSAGMRTTYSVIPKKEIPHPPCYAHERWSRNFELYCPFGNLSSVEDLQLQGDGTIEVCSRTYVRGIIQCKTTIVIPVTEIYYLDISGNYEMSPENFRDCIEVFTNIRYLNAGQLGLRYLLHDTFWKSKYLRSISFMKNRLRAIPEELFSRNRRLRYINLSQNNLNSVQIKQMNNDKEGMKTSGIKRHPYGVKASVNLLDNPKLKNFQKLYHHGQRN